MKLKGEIVRLRKANGLTQEQLAERLAVSRQAVAKWESGEAVPELEKLVRLSEVFATPLDVLIHGSGDCTPVPAKLDYQQQQLIAFLCRAKVKTYAGKGAEVASCRIGSHDLRYQEGELSYLDSYLGNEKFAGEEAIWLGDTPVWAMNYVGRVLSPRFSSDFLKQALTAVEDSMPYRGPQLFSQGDYTYLCQVEGFFNWFNGTEQIFFRQEKVYECAFHGGDII
ncbi:DUF5680 domain-containing protein [Motilimonas sp. KMU-193]|uniref:DUF5680 domain-containing protein n=1 Tax=Motilimonas sp. KMU-193 TaxID=3388668 RepID=UPI00396B40DE